MDPDRTAGFIQSDGCFQLKRVLRPGRSRPEWRVVLQVDQAQRELLDELRLAYGGYVGFRAKQNTYYYSSVSFRNVVPLIHMLDHHPVYDQKLAAYRVWRQAYVLIQNRDHLTDEGQRRLCELKDDLGRINQAGK